jgi:hypothetical protein
MSPREEQFMEFLRTLAPGGVLPEQGEFALESLALLQVVAYLERNYGLRLAELEIEPDDLRSVAGILGLIERYA